MSFKSHSYNYLSNNKVAFSMSYCFHIYAKNIKNTKSLLIMMHVKLYILVYDKQHRLDKLFLPWNVFSFNSSEIAV